MAPLPFRHRIGTRVLAALLCVSFLSLSISLVLLVFQADRFLKDGVSQRNLQIARLASDEIGRYMDLSVSEIQSLARLLSPLPYSPWILGAILANATVEFPRFGWMYLVGPDGSRIADSGFTTGSGARALEPAALSAIREKGAYMSEVRLSDTNIPVMDLGVSAKLPDGRTGALVAELSLRDIWGLVDGISVGKKGLTYLVSGRGILIAHPDKVKILSQWSGMGNPTPVKNVGSEGLVNVTDVPGQGQILTAYTRVSNQDWIVAVQQPIQEAYLPAALLIQHSIIIIAVGVALSIILSVIFSRNISRPLETLTEGTRIVASGVLDHRIVHHSEDEIGQLAQSFNAMVESLKGRTRALEESERKHRLVTEKVNDLIFSLDEDGRMVFASPRITAISGYELTEVIGRRFSEFLAEKGDTEAWNAFLDSAWDEERRETELEVKLKSKKGRHIILELNISKERDPGGGARFYGVGRDVSERKRLEEQLIQAQRMEAVGRLSGGIAHDFNNLLTAMIGYCDLALEDIGASDPLRATIEEVRKAGTRAADLTKQLLAFSRKQILRPRIIDLNAVIIALKGMLERLIGENIRLVTRLDQSLGRISADPSQMEQIIMNLCLNSRDAMPNGGEVILSTTNIEIGEDITMDGAIVPKGEYMSLTVSDMGVGMDEETQAHVFEPFYTTKRQGKGTGLGLSTVYGIVKQSGGHIRFSSAPGRGTSFELIFPRTLEGRRDEQAANVEKRLTGNETVMLVEDDPTIRRMMQETLEKSGYTVVTAASAEQALEVTGTHGGSIHLVVLDLVLPGMSGKGLGERLRAIMAGTRIMYISGYARDALSHEGKLPLGASFLQKPFPPTVFLSAVRDVLDNPG